LALADIDEGYDSDFFRFAGGESERGLADERIEEGRLNDIGIVLTQVVGYSDPPPSFIMLNHVDYGSVSVARYHRPMTIRMAQPCT
jgi:hypothetical protein